MSNASGGSPNQRSSFASPAPDSNTTTKKKRNLPGNPDPDAEVIALSPKSLMAINRFMCEVCNKGFQRDQNLQLHRRGHNLPWKLKQRSTGKDGAVRKKAYVCPEASCVHHHPSRALGDLTGIKKHFSRKHGEKKYKCDKCSKKYAVHSDWKAHSKTCGTREYKCDCGTIFSRRDSFITHRAFCDALAEESVPKSNPYGHPLFSSSSCHDPSFSTVLLPKELGTDQHYFNNINAAWLPTSTDQYNTTTASNINNYSSPVLDTSAHHENTPLPLASSYQQASAAANSAHLSATALLQKAAQMGAAMSQRNAQIMAPHSISAPTTNVGSRNEEGGGGGGGGDGLTRDFLGLRALSHKDILSMAAAGACLPCMSSPSTFDQHCQHNNNNNNNITKPWHG